MIDAASFAGRGIGVAASAGIGATRFAGRGVGSVFRKLRPWLWRAAFVSLLVAAAGLFVAVQVEYNGNWALLFRDMGHELRGVLREIQREIF